MVKAIETMRRRFAAAARNKPSFPLELIAGLRGARIGLINFSEEEANRIRSAANSPSIPLVIERIKSDSLENQTGYTALIVNECGVSTRSLLCTGRSGPFRRYSLAPARLCSRSRNFRRARAIF